MDNPDHGIRYAFHLFAGSGGGILADLLLDREIVGAVEIAEYQRQTLLARQRDGILPRFPIWDDVCTFRLDNPETAEYIEWLKSIRDELIICGGFPCQDISIANNKAEGIEGERSGLWKEMRRIVGEIRPKHILLENSPMLLVRGFDSVASDLASMRYSLTWRIMGADEVGAWHRRDRFWGFGTRED